MDEPQDMESIKAELAALHAESFGWALACCDRHVADAEDVLQAAYVKVLTGQASFAGRSSLKTWFFAIVRFTAHEIRRRRKSRGALLLSWFTREPAASVEDAEQEQALQGAEDRVRVRAALATLSEQQRRVLELVFYHDMTIEEASQVMDINLGTARTHYARGKRQVLKALGVPEADTAEPAAAMRLHLVQGA
jgi:RNA polymerase sigma-70 factor, ECF subfamily